jgi:aspartate-semialdehyde dehydrogenase
MPRDRRVAVIGATGLVGREILNVLQERQFPVGELLPMASERSAGTKVEFGGHSWTVQDAARADFRGIDIALMSAGAKTSAVIAPRAAEAGCRVIDNSSQWRLDAQVPLIVPEVNAGALGDQRIIANPNCSTIQMLVALNPLHRMAGLRRVVVASYQAVSGKGKAAMDELAAQVTALFGQRDPQIQVFSKRIAFNCLPSIDVMQDDGYTKEEHKMRDESRKILGLPGLSVCATCVRVPVFNGHAEAVVAEFERPLPPATARALLREAPGVVLLEDDYPTQLDANGQDATYVGRVRADDGVANGLAFWCVADNLRKGAATNAVQIAELVLRRLA